MLGSPRSGTTLVRRILDAHPEIACPGETNVFSACARFMHSETIAEGVQVGALSGLAFAGIPEDVVLGRLREMAFGFHRDCAKAAGKPRWASKTAFDLFHLDAIEKLCGAHSRFLCIQRHGLDVACSLKELCDTNGGYLSELHEYVKRHARPLEAFCHAWVDLNRALLAFIARHRESTLVIRYEDLVADPGKALRAVAEFAGVQWSDGWVANALKKSGNIGLGDWKTYDKSAVDDSSVSRWKQLSPHTIGQLARICNPTLEACGYAPVAVEGDRSAEEARRRYELGLRLKASMRSAKS